MGLLYLERYQMPHEWFLIEPHPFDRIEDHLNWDVFPHDSKKEKGISPPEAMELHCMSKAV